MKSTMSLPVLFAALALATAANAQPTWLPGEEISWAWEYTADALPNEADVHWSTIPNPGTEAVLEADGLRVMDQTAQQGSLRRYTRSWRVDPTAGGVIEARIKVVDNNAFCGVGLMLADGVHEAHLTLYPDRVDMNNGVATHAMDTTDDFHTYRLAARGKDFLLWVDGELVIDGTGLHTHPAHAARCRVSFGSGASAAVSEAIYAAVRYAPFRELPLPERMSRAKDIVVYKEPGIYACFPSMYRTEGGDLVASFATRVRRSHIDGTGGGAARISRDGGHTWEPLEGRRPLNPQSRSADGSLVIADAYGWREVPAARREEFAQQNITVRDVREGVVAYLQGARVRRSIDDGATWRSEEIELPPHRSLMSYRRVDQASLSPGLRVVSIYGKLKDDTHSRAFLLRSEDDGQQWEFLPLATRNGMNLNETALAQNADGDLVAMIRAEPPAGGNLHTTISTDAGLTWEPVQETGLWGYPAHLLRLQDGRMLCTFGYRRTPMGIRAAISADGGRTWSTDDEVILRNDGMHHGSDLGYPISIETDPGHIVTIYYMTNDDGVTHIAVTHWDAPG
jgi:hypothetical protein